MPQLRVGISGWTYQPWRGTFYPKDLPHNKELWYASRQVNSIEINGSFYSLQSPGSYQSWYDQTPDDFVFSIKGGQFITHMKRLKNVQIALANFFASGVLALREKLGPILWQLPPNMTFDADVLEVFLKLLPRDTVSAAKLARGHDDRLKHRAFLRVDVNRPLRYAVEARHASFVDRRFLKLLRKHKIAVVVADTAGKWPLFETATTEFIYCRLHGDEQLYASGYTDEALDAWARKIRGWRKGRRRDVYVYFDNDVKVRAPVDAMSLARRLGQA